MNVQHTEPYWDEIKRHTMPTETWALFEPGSHQRSTPYQTNYFVVQAAFHPFLTHCVEG